MQGAYRLSKILADVAPGLLLARRQVDASLMNLRARQVDGYSSAHLPTPEDGPSETLRSAFAQFLSAVSRTYQDEPEEAYRYVMDAAELLHAVAASAFAGFHLHNDIQSTAPQTRRGGLAPWMVRKVSTYIETHLGSTVSAADLAGLAQQSVYHFSRAFRQSFDEPPHTYLMRRRIERAKGLMMQTNLPLAQIAIDCGLADQPHLNKSFRRFVGESPGAWRRARAVAPDLTIS